MIPSRPLEFGDFFGQTFSLFAKTFTRYALLFLLFYLPGAALLTYSSIGLIRTGISVSQHRTGFNDQDLLVLRNRMREELYKSNPGLRDQYQEPPLNDTVHRSSSTTATSDSVLQQLPARRPWHLTYVITTYASEFAGESTLFFFGCLLLFLGFSGLNSGTTELTCRAFEERDLRFGEALQDTLKRHLWSILALMAIWLGGSFALAILRSIFTSASDSVGSFFFLLITAGELLLFVRLSLAIPAIVSEGMGPVRAMARSWQLTEGHWWRVFGLLGGFGLLMLGVTVVVFAISSLFVAGSAFLWWKDFLSAPVVTIPNFLNGMSSFIEAMVIFLSIPLFLLFPCSSIFTTLLYYDLRTRKEGPLVYSDTPIDPNPVVMWQP